MEPKYSMIEVDLRTKCPTVPVLGHVPSLMVSLLLSVQAHRYCLSSKYWQLMKPLLPYILVLLRLRP